VGRLGETHQTNGIRHERHPACASIRWPLLHIRDPLEQDNAPLTVSVIKQNEDGSYVVEVIVNAQ